MTDYGQNYETPAYGPNKGKAPTKEVQDEWGLVKMFKEVDEKESKPDEVNNEHQDYETLFIEQAERAAGYREGGLLDYCLKAQRETWQAAIAQQQN